MVFNEEFKSLLKKLQCEENDIRSQAETAYDSIDAKSKLEMLLQLLSSQQEEVDIRTFAGVLCRRLLDSCLEEAFLSLPKDSQTFTKQKLLEWIVNENQPTIRKKLSEITIEIAKEDFDDSGNLLWPELLQFVFDGCLNSTDSGLKVIGLLIFGSLPNLLGEQLASNIDSVCQIFAKTMNQTDETGLLQNMEVRIASVKTFSSFVVSQIDENTPFRQMFNIIPMMLHTIADSILSDSMDDSCMKALVDLADSASEFLKSRITDVLQLCLTILHNDNVDDSQKHLAVEVFVTLSENIPGAVRKCSSQMQGIIHVLFKMLTDLDDDPDWATMDIEEDEDDTNSSIVAEMALDRISCAMRGKKVLHEITRTVPAMLHSTKWQERHGGLMAISSCAEGLSKVMEEILGSIIDEIVPLLSDSHPRVRYAACNAVGQLSTDFGDKLQKTYHAKVIPALMLVLDDDMYPRVQAYAGAAMVNFFESSPKNILIHYLPVLAEKLLHVLQKKYSEFVQTGRKLVLEQIVTTTAALADSLGEDFAAYYDNFMQFLKFLMNQCVGDSLRLLRGKTIECISLMGLAVGRDRFLPDAQDVMQLLLKTQTTEGENEDDSSPADDPQQSYMISAWARICKLLGKSFAEFLPIVMKSVLKTASIKPDVCMMYNDEAEDVDKEWQVVKIADDQNFAIHTSGLEDKATACQMLVCYARELSDAFCPYVLQVADIMIPLLKFYFNDEVRSSAADIIPYLLDCSTPLGVNVTEQLWDRMIAALLNAIPNEPYKAQIADMMDALAEGIRKMGRQSVTAERMPLLIDIMNRQFDDLFKNQDSRLEKRKSDEYDEEDEENLENDKDEDDDILCKIVDVMHSLLLAYKEDALPVFDVLLPNIIRLLEPGKPWTDMQFGICFWDDVIECTGHASWRYCQTFLPAMINGLHHEQKEIRQATVYGFGMMAMFGGRDYSDILREVAPVLISLVEGQYSREESVNISTENAISALTKICKYRSECMPDGGDVNGFINKWIGWLPIWEDVEETPHVFGFLCDLVESNNPIAIGHQNENLPHIVKSIAFCLEKEGLPVESPAYRRCLNIVKMIQTSGGDCFATCFNGLSKEEQMALQKAMENVHLL